MGNEAESFVCHNRYSVIEARAIVSVIITSTFANIEATLKQPGTGLKLSNYSLPPRKALFSTPPDREDLLPLRCLACMGGIHASSLSGRKLHQDAEKVKGDFSDCG